MGNLEQEYKDVVERLKRKSKELYKIYNENEEVRKFLKMQKEEIELQKEKAKLEQEINVYKWSTCNHIWLITKQSYDSGEGRTYNYCSCVKCGLSYEIFEEYETVGKEILNNEKKAQMFDFLQEHPSARYKGLKSNYFCNLQKAQSIYEGIKKRNPDLTEEMILQLLEEKLSKKNETRKRKKGEK